MLSVAQNQMDIFFSAGQEKLRSFECEVSIGVRKQHFHNMHIRLAHYRTRNLRRACDKDWGGGSRRGQGNRAKNLTELEEKVYDTHRKL